MFLLRTEAGLSATETGQVLGRSRATVRDLSRLVARGQRGGDLVASARRVLDRRSDRRERPSPVWMPRPLPELKRCRIAAGVTQEELAGRARVVRETLCKIERGRPATRETVRRLAAALADPPGVLAGTVTGTRCEPEPPFAEPESTRTLPSAPGVEPAPVMDHPGGARLAAQPARAITDRGAPRVSRRLPGLRQWRTQAGLMQQQLASRADLARETLIRIEHQQQGARSATIQRLAEALLVAPSMLTGSSDLDALIDEPLRTCTDCGALRPARALLPIAGTPYVYGRCRLCRNRHNRERYYSAPDVLAAERARSRRNKQVRNIQPVPRVTRRTASRLTPEQQLLESQQAKGVTCAHADFETWTVHEHRVDLPSVPRVRDGLGQG
jgi:transcriptional regulator with XRE-family HTH domain